MKRNPIPENADEAAALISRLPETPRSLDLEDFLQFWAAMAYTNPGLHPDLDEVETTWPEPFELWRRDAERRHREKSIGDDEFYPTNAAWAGLFDRFTNPSPDEVRRRHEIRLGGFAA